MAEMVKLVQRVRKHGEVKVGTRDEARQLVEAGKAHGYRFGIVKTSFFYLVVDLDD